MFSLSQKTNKQKNVWNWFVRIDQTLKWLVRGNSIVQTKGDDPKENTITLSTHHYNRLFVKSLSPIKSLKNQNQSAPVLVSCHVKMPLTREDVTIEIQQEASCRTGEMNWIPISTAALFWSLLQKPSKWSVCHHWDKREPWWPSATQNTWSEMNPDCWPEAFKREISPNRVSHGDISAGTNCAPGSTGFTVTDSSGDADTEAILYLGSYFRGKVHKISPMVDFNKKALHRKWRSSDIVKFTEKTRNTSS